MDISEDRIIWLNEVSKEMVEHAIEMRNKYGRDFISRHEAISVIREEFEEAWDAIKNNSGNHALYEELKQIGAMTMLFAELVVNDNTERKIF
jgi:23S rRNA A2030 N6-methylase RlmJ